MPDPPFVVESAPATEPATEKPAESASGTFAGSATGASDEPATVTSDESVVKEQIPITIEKDTESTTTLGRWKKWLKEKVDVLTKEEN